MPTNEEKEAARLGAEGWVKLFDGNHHKGPSREVQAELQRLTESIAHSKAESARIRAETARKVERHQAEVDRIRVQGEVDRVRAQQDADLGARDDLLVGMADMTEEMATLDEMRDEVIDLLRVEVAELKDAVATLAAIISAPRRKVAIRDDKGDIIETREEIMDDEARNAK
jgi:hypothetical protein